MACSPSVSWVGRVFDADLLKAVFEKEGVAFLVLGIKYVLENAHVSGGLSKLTQKRLP